MADDGTIYVGNGGGVCNGFSGKDFKQVFSTPAPHADNVHFHSGNSQVYVGQDELLSVLDAKTGALKWKHDNKMGWVIASPAVQNGIVYARAGFTRYDFGGTEPGFGVSRSDDESRYSPGFQHDFRSGAHFNMSMFELASGKNVSFDPATPEGDP